MALPVAGIVAIFTPATRRISAPSAIAEGKRSLGFASRARAATEINGFAHGVSSETVAGGCPARALSRISIPSLSTMRGLPLSASQRRAPML
jgi:hypothetical protein